VKGISRRPHGLNTFLIRKDCSSITVKLRAFQVWQDKVIYHHISRTIDFAAMWSVKISLGTELEIAQIPRIPICIVNQQLLFELP
jgi:hypothetical protein